MKTFTRISFAVLLTVIASPIFAQKQANIVNIVPTSEPGILKIIYAAETESPIVVRFFSDGNMVKSDKIKDVPHRNGISKRYDVRNINAMDFWVEISSADGLVLYHIKPSKDRKSFVPYLEKVTQNFVAVAKKE